MHLQKGQHFAAMHSPLCSILWQSSVNPFGSRADPLGRIITCFISVSPRMIWVLAIFPNAIILGWPRPPISVYKNEEKWRYCSEHVLRTYTGPTMIAWNFYPLARRFVNQGPNKLCAGNNDEPFKKMDEGYTERNHFGRKDDFKSMTLQCIAQWGHKHCAANSSSRKVQINLRKFPFPSWKTSWVCRLMLLVPRCN